MTGLTVIPGSNQKLLATEMMQEILAVIHAPKYDNITNATVLGVIEMVKLHHWQENLSD
jgi:hypothetical protein